MTKLFSLAIALLLFAVPFAAQAQKTTKKTAKAKLTAKKK
jgi:hypothetical protein